MEFDRAAEQLANKLMEYLKQNGWDCTLPLIREIQQKESETAKKALKSFESYIVNSGNPDFIISYVREIEGADLSQLFHGLIMIEDDLEICSKKDERFYRKIKKYKKEIGELLREQQRVYESDIRNLIDDL